MIKTMGEIAYELGMHFAKEQRLGKGRRSWTTRYRSR